jgi:hypothetical protein
MLACICDACVYLTKNDPTARSLTVTVLWVGVWWGMLWDVVADSVALDLQTGVLFILGWKLLIGVFLWYRCVSVHRSED